MPGIAERHHHALADAARRLGIGGRQYHDELFSAETADQIRLASVAPKYARGRLQHAVAGLLAEITVEFFEMIQIREGHTQGPFVARRVVEFAPEDNIEMSAVVDAGQLVAPGLFLEF